VLRGKLKGLAETNDITQKSGGRTAGMGYQLDGNIEDGPIEDDDDPFMEDRSQVLLLQRMLAGADTYKRVGFVNFWTDEWFIGCPLQEINLV
jgi:hypothetical protein